MKVLLVDVDGKIPNLALMKLSRYYKNKGASIDFKRFEFKAFPHTKRVLIDAHLYDVVRVSTIFTQNKNRVMVRNCANVRFGGTGHSIMSTLSKQIDNLEEDYSLYPMNDTSYGFITRGCPKRCSFCFVPEKEGKLILYREPHRVIKHTKVKFLDNNFLAYDRAKDILRRMNELKIRYQFNQGLDIQYVDDEVARLLGDARYLGNYIFAFDDIRYESMVTKRLKLLRRYIKRKWHITFFVLVGYNSTIKEDLHRVAFCRRHHVYPYIMRHKRCWESADEYFYTDIANYCNQPGVFKNMTFLQYLERKHTNKDRIKMVRAIARG